MAGSPAPASFNPNDKPTEYQWLQFTDLVEGNNKEILVEKYANGVVRARFGKTGSVNSGSAQTTFPSHSAKPQSFEAYIYEKCNRRSGDRYHKVEMAMMAAVPVPSKAPALVKSAKVSDTAVARFIARIISESRISISATLDKRFAIGDLSPAQLAEGSAVLDEIGTALGARTRPTDRWLLDMANKYFSTIPHSTGDGELQIPRHTRDNPLAAAITTLDRVQKEFDWLQNLRDATAAKAAFATDDSDKQVAGIGAEVDLADSKATKEIQDFLVKSKGHHGFGLKPGLVYVVANNMVRTRYLQAGKSVGNIQRLWHGSRISNWVGILGQGLRIKPSGIPTAGSMFGNGVYFADQSSKSAQYCGSGGYRSRDSNVLYLAVAEVALGKQKIEYNSVSYDRPPKEYHSVWGKAGQGLYNNEYIIYNEAQHDLQYIIEFQMN